jgi:hypothetical protein
VRPVICSDSRPVIYPEVRPATAFDDSREISAASDVVGA